MSFISIKKKKSSGYSNLEIIGELGEKCVWRGGGEDMREKTEAGVVFREVLF